MIEETPRGGIDRLVMPIVATMFDATIERGGSALDVLAAASVPA